MDTEEYQDQWAPKREAIKKQIYHNLQEHKQRKAAGHKLRNVFQDPANAELAKYCCTNPIVAACYNQDATIEQLALYLVRENERLIEVLHAAAACANTKFIVVHDKEMPNDNQTL